MKRAPIVVVMGHVDHGKTTLLDYIRKSSIAAKEAGGITQSIGAYEIEHKKEKITFIDTPGHESFMKMRQRGANIADLGILVVAGDDSVQNQTKEAFKILEESKTPMIVAINKIDKLGIEIDKVKSDLAGARILLEGYGGNISWQAISAKTGEGINELLDLILLASELENLGFDPNMSAEGFILEAKMDNRRGIIVSGIIKNGTLKIGSEIFSSTASGKVKSLENFLGKKIVEAQPSMPVLISGFNQLPKAGDEFSTDLRLRIKDLRLENKIINNVPVVKNENKTVLNLILKADTGGSLEVLSGIIKSLPTEQTKLSIINESVGEITDGDVKSAIATKSLIIGFRSKLNKAADNLARAQKVKVIASEIIYQLIKSIEDELKGADKEIITGDLEILAVFNKKGDQQIIGGKVLSGEIKNNSVLEVQRRGSLAGRGKIVNLQQGKTDVKKVDAGKECGLLFDTKVGISIGDHLVSKI